jgi:hypothetical protein
MRAMRGPAQGVRGMDLNHERRDSRFQVPVLSDA